MNNSTNMAKQSGGHWRGRDNLIEAFRLPKGVGGTEPDWDGATDDQIEHARGLAGLQRAGEQ